MKKINLFNRNTNLPSYRGAGPSKNVPSFRGNAESPRCCRELVCGKTDGIPLFSGMTAVIFALFIATPSFAEPTELDKKTVASKAYVDTKQDIIQTGNILFYDDVGTENDLYVPGLVAYDSSTGSLKGNQIGILDQETIADDEGRLYMYSDVNYDNGEMDNFVPTVRAVADDLQHIWENMPFWTTLSWVLNNDNGANRTNAINAYSTTFANNGTNTWAESSTNLINGQFLANSLALKQNKISKSGYYYNTSGTLTAYGNSSATNGWLHAGVKGTGLVTKTATEGVVGERKIFEATDVANYHADGMSQNAQNIQDISIPTVGAVMSIVNTNAPTGTPGNVAMYDATTGALGDGVATYDGSTTYNASTDADKIAVMSGVQRKKECGGYEPAPAGQPAHDGTHPGDEDYCWLWIFPD